MKTIKEFTSEIIAAMLHFGLSGIALATNKGEENEVS